MGICIIIRSQARVRSQAVQIRHIAFIADYFVEIFVLFDDHKNMLKQWHLGSDYFGYRGGKPMR